MTPRPGYFAIELAKLGNYEIAGLDISETFVEIARANAAEARAGRDASRSEAWRASADYRSRKDAPRESIGKAVDEMRLGAVKGVVTKLTFRFMLLKRAYTKDEFEQMIAETKFQDVEIEEDLMGVEIALTKG